MAVYSITIDAAGSNKINEQERNINTLFPYTNGTYKTITKITRRDGIWCSAGGKYQSVTMEVYDELLVGEISIKRSDTVGCKTYAKGPNRTNSGNATDENYAETTFSNWTKSESNAAIEAWKNNELIIRRHVTIVEATSSNHEQPEFRDGYYSDTITITGEDVPPTNYGPSIVTFDVFRSDDDGATENPNSETVWAKIKLNMKDAAGGITANPQLLVYYAENRDPRVGSSPCLDIGLSQFTMGVDAKIKLSKPSGTWNKNTDYYFMLYFSAGEEIATPKIDVAQKASVPVFISENNNGVAIGQYSTATSSEPKFECNWPTYFYDNPAIKEGTAEIRKYVSDPEAVGELLGTATTKSRICGIANIQTGEIRDVTIGAGQVIEIKDIKFPRPFTENPTVIVGFAASSGNAEFGKCTCSTSGIGTYSFSARVNYSGDSGPRYPSIDWIAVGIPS